jgi:hypothetical protein
MLARQRFPQSERPLSAACRSKQPPAQQRQADSPDQAASPVRSEAWMTVNPYLASQQCQGANAEAGQ